MKMTDECQKLGEEAEKIFNTIIEVIFDQKANDPYLKSDERVGMYFSRPVKVSKLLKKIKKMNTISTHYKIRQDISSQNRLRSIFKRVFITKRIKTENEPLIIETATAYIPRFCKKHAEAAYNKKVKDQLISPFEDLIDNNETDFARHLQDNLSMTGHPILPIRVENITVAQLQSVTSATEHVLDEGLHIFLEPLSPASKRHEELILQKFRHKHPNIVQYYSIENIDQSACQSLRITENLPCIPLAKYLEKHRASISLWTRLDIMTQICHVI